MDFKLVLLARAVRREGDATESTLVLLLVQVVLLSSVQPEPAVVDERAGAVLALPTASDLTRWRQSSSRTESLAVEIVRRG